MLIYIFLFFTISFRSQQKQNTAAHFYTICYDYKAVCMQQLYFRWNPSVRSFFCQLTTLLQKSSSVERYGNTMAIWIWRWGSGLALLVRTDKPFRSLWMIHLCYFGNAEASVLIHAHFEELRPSLLFFFFNFTWISIWFRAAHSEHQNEVQNYREWDAQTA